ncbi:hypothetical protein [Maridesulfovibrio sp.]|uniref:hypothetical protein n=1 Tax=Maridesulfovibrio sp. TaxID=2795000 RepID=UPI002AA84F8E|nr:hypothetical protein [Maridesulfovibrio sp.]
MLNEGEVLKGKLLDMVLDSEITRTQNEIERHLAQFDPDYVFDLSHSFFRSMEEFINIFLETEFSECVPNSILNVRLGNSYLHNESNQRDVAVFLINKYDKRICRRVLNFLIMTSAFKGAAEANHGMGYFKYRGGPFSVGEAAKYYQSRRKTIVDLLFYLPGVCVGNRKPCTEDFFYELMHVAETGLSSLHLMRTKQVLALLHNDYEVTVVDNGLLGNMNLEVLEDGFYEPQRISLVDQQKYRESDSVQSEYEDVPTGVLFSVQEFRNSMRIILDQVDDFRSRDQAKPETSAFTASYSLFMKVYEILLIVSSHCSDGYNIDMGFDKFLEIVTSVVGDNVDSIFNVMCCEGRGWFDLVGTEYCFIIAGGKVRSNVNLMMRFSQYLSNKTLEKNKKFQINSGFLFEKKLRDILINKGFKSENITRIENKEFDVIVSRDNVVYNFQCKNNILNVRDVDVNVKRFVRHNKRLVNSFKNALEKECQREDLLKKKLGVNSVCHYVVSRFPVFSENDSIISYNKFEEFVDEILLQN